MKQITKSSQLGYRLSKEPTGSAGHILRKIRQLFDIPQGREGKGREGKGRERITLRHSILSGFGVHYIRGW